MVAENAAGEKRVVAVTKKLQDAKDKAVVMENDFKMLGRRSLVRALRRPAVFRLRLIVVRGRFTRTAACGGSMLKPYPLR